ncbi:hypothetical protein ACFP1L_03210 [Lactiplantibacillus nangangensis]|uniref:Integral membrane protein n=1 Tax=Lactiplantibacillus nangangensis TaxID=2559917 RepID=A0ABW1SHX4_9LACO|nr:hypothetical protein [Lactiplantibacillus nangangensis]
MQLKRPISFYKSFGFWLGLVFVWVTIFGFPHTMITAGDIFTYPIIFILACASIWNSFFELKPKHS